MKRSTKRFARASAFVLFAAVAGLSGAVRGAPLDDRVPASAIAYAGWAGADALADQYGKSNLKGILDASTAGNFIKNMLPGLLDNLNAGGDPDAAKKMALVQKALDLAWRHPTAFYFNGVDMSNPRQPIPRIGLIIDAGPDAKAVLELLNGVFANNPPPPFFKVTSVSGVISLSLGADDSSVDIKQTGGLAATAAYKAAMGNAKNATPALAVYGDMTKGIALLKDAMDKLGAPPEAKEHIPVALDALGITGMTQFAYTAGFDGKQWKEDSFVGMTGPRKGILALMDGTALSEGVLAMVPKDAVMFSAWKLDLHKLYTEAREVIGKIDPPTQKQFDQAVAQIGAMTKLDLEKDLLSALGDEMVLYRAPIADSGAQSIALVSKLKDGDAFSKTLAVAEQMINAQLKDSPIKIEKVTVWKTEVSTVAITQLNVAWTVKNNVLYVSTLEGIGGAMKQVENKLPSVADNADFKAARPALPANAKVLSLSYSNPAKTYPELRALALGLLPLARAAKVNIPNDILPDPDDVKQFMTPGVAVSWSDATGVHATSKTAFPGAELIGGQTGGLNSVAVVALGAGIALPSLGQARQTAQQTVDATNLKSLGISCAISAADNNNVLPDDIAAFVRDGMVPPKVLIDPRSGNTPLEMTPEMTAMAKNDFAKFAAELAKHCDYVYLGKGMKYNMPNSANIVIIYDKPRPGLGRGINAAFVDGHVQMVPWGTVPVVFNQTNDYLRKNNLPEVDVQALMNAAGVAAPPTIMIMPTPGQPQPNGNLP